MTNTTPFVSPETESASLGILRPVVVLFFLLSVLTGLLYPLLTTVVAQVLFPAEAAGSLIVKDGKAVGSALIGQSFTDPAHFWGRPSATGPQPNNAAASGGSNQGPLNPALVEAVKGRVQALRDADPGNTAPVPVDLVTASASGLDPHISVAAAQYQLKRVVAARKLDEAKVQALVEQSIERPLWGLLGEAGVNVLHLNLALDALKP
jgi:K+-transporting ATPase ATPase C chain